MIPSGSEPATAIPKVQYLNRGILDYKEAWDFQESLFNRVTTRKTSNRDLPAEHQVTPENFLVLCSHPHVYTLGKSGEENHLLVNGDQLAQLHAAFYKINRGGDITYHGPGQIVGYPILDLDQFFTDIHKYLRFLEEIIIRTLSDFGIAAGRYEGYTGVWIDADIPAKARKICAMGVRTSRWVTMHGWALNVNTDLSYFGNIVPCGINDKAVTSMEKELGRHIDENAVTERIIFHFAALFSCEIVTD